jgi:hypothetical protein
MELRKKYNRLQLAELSSNPGMPPPEDVPSK